MKKQNTILRPGLPVLLSVLLAFAACQNGWDEHYHRTVEGKSDRSLFEYIATQDDLSDFASLLVETGYDTILNANQVLTVWAPTNEALATVDWSTVTDRKLFVESYICWFSKPVRDARDLTVTTLNNKRLVFTGDGRGYLFDDRPILESDIALRNGLLHVLGGYVPYRLNIWDYIQQAQGMEAFQAYVNSLFESELDGEASFDDNGILIDSVMKITHPFLTFLGALDQEDSTYTMVMPDDQAWDEGLSLTMSYFKTLPADGGEEVQLANAKWTLVKDLVFRDRLKAPYTDTVLFSTSQTKMGAPDSLFVGMTLTELSNGYAYTTSRFPYKPIPTWHKEIRIEAEDNFENLRVPNNYTLVNTSSVGSGLDVSGRAFVTANPKTSSSISKLFIRFPIPNTLSAKYNIYVVTVPSNVVDKNDKRPYKLNFYLSYINAAGKVVADERLLTNVVTDTTQMTKVLVAENFSFPYSNIVNLPGLTGSNDVTVNIRVENAAGVTASELANFNRTIRVDCILLEPVQ